MGVDPVSAISNAIGSIANAIGLGIQRGTLRDAEKTQQQAEEQARVIGGNAGILPQLIPQTSNTVIYLIVGAFTLVAVMVAYFAFSKK